LAFALVLDAQKQGEPVAWVTQADSTFFPPDAVDGGVDLNALSVIRVPGVTQVFRAADHLARSGAFGLLVLDLGPCAPMPMPVQTRLAGLATRHGTLILCLTEKQEKEPSLGSLISLRGEVSRARRGDNRFACAVRALKDKRRGPGWVHVELCRGPDGLR
jgi:recombination protein RecA